MQSSASKPLFYIGVPTIGQHSYLFTQSMLGAIMPSNFSMKMQFISSWEVGRARNMFAQEAVNIGAKYLMFRDEDTLAPANIIPYLLYHMERNPSWTFLGGLYATKSFPPEPLVYKEWGQGPFYNFHKGEMLKVLYTGMGASMIRVSDLLALPTTTYKEKNPWTNEINEVHEWFRTDTSGSIDYIGRKVEKNGHTEDAFFFDMLDKAGLKAFVDTNMLCGHYDKNTNMIFYPTFDGEVCINPEPWDMTPRVVNLGAGGEYDAKELQVDLSDDPHIDLRCDIRKLPLEWEDQFDKAKAHHVLEHFDFEEVPVALAEWLRILKPGGRVEISVPDLQTYATRLVEGDIDVVMQGGIYGDQGHPFWRQKPYGGFDENKVRWLKHSTQINHHNSGYTADYLLNLMKDVGYVDVKAERHLEYAEIRAIGYKPTLELAPDEFILEQPVSEEVRAEQVIEEMV